MKKQINRKKARAVFLLAVTVLILGMCVGCGQKAGKTTDTGVPAAGHADTRSFSGESGALSFDG